MRDAAVVRYRGLMQEKFIERALAENIRIQSVRRIGDHEMLLRVDEAAAEKLLQMGERFSLDIKLVRHSAAGDAARIIRRRMSLVPALMLCAAMLVFFASRIWLIELRIDDEIYGGTSAPDGGQALLDGLRALGVRPGASQGAIDTDELALLLQQRAPDYAFIGVRRTGVRLLVEAVRELPAPDLYSLDGARDLVSDSDAIVVSIEALTGVANVKIGDTVRRGQVLIRGEEKVTPEATHGVCALGEVIARCWATGEAEGSAVNTKRVYTGRESLSSELRLMDFFHPLASGEAFENEEVTVRKLPVGGLFLPLNIVSTQRREYEESSYPADIDAVKQSVSEIAFKIAASNLPEACVIVDKWIDYSMIEGDKIHARAVIEYHRNIAVSRQALYDGGM